MYSRSISRFYDQSIVGDLRHHRTPLFPEDLFNGDGDRLLVDAVGLGQELPDAVGHLLFLVIGAAWDHLNGNVGHGCFLLMIVDNMALLLDLCE